MFSPENLKMCWKTDAINTTTNKAFLTKVNVQHYEWRKLWRPLYFMWSQGRSWCKMHFSIFFRVMVSVWGLEFLVSNIIPVCRKIPDKRLKCWKISLWQRVYRQLCQDSLSLRWAGGLPAAKGSRSLTLRPNVLLAVGRLEGLSGQRFKDLKRIRL